MSESLAVILAAGFGTRMRSSLPKVMHEVGNRALLGHVLAAVEAAEVGSVAVVVGADNQAVADYVSAVAPTASQHVQVERLGTAHALLAARPALEAHRQGTVLVLFGDTPLISANTLTALNQALDAGAAVAVAGFETQNPGPYGRLLVEDGTLKAIREAKDCTLEELQVTLCNGGVMGFRAEHCVSILDQIGQQNAQGEYYLTDAVEVANRAGLKVAVVTVAEEEIMGVNDRLQLAAAEEVFQTRARIKAMQQGVTLQNPASVYLSADTVLEADVVIEPFVVLGPKVCVKSGSRIQAFSHLKDCVVSP